MRWLHVTAAIAWIGTSFYYIYYIALDFHLLEPKNPTEEARDVAAVPEPLLPPMSSTLQAGVASESIICGRHCRTPELQRRAETGGSSYAARRVRVVGRPLLRMDGAHATDASRVHIDNADSLLG